MRHIFFIGIFLVTGMSGAWAQASPPPITAPYEIISDDFDTEILAQGRFITSEKAIYHLLSEAGIQALQQMHSSFMPGYQDMQVTSAVVIKKNGTRQTVPASNILRGQGEADGNGYQGSRYVTVVFPNLEIGDQVELQTMTSQNVPWFPGVFAHNWSFTPTVKVAEATVSLTAPAGAMPRNIAVVGFQEGQEQTLGGKTRRIWHYTNATPAIFEPDAALDMKKMPHVWVSTVHDYADVAKLIEPAFKDKSATTPEIKTLADQLTKGVADKKQKARILYGWVSTNIRYIAIVFGDGGYVPNPAGQVLQNKYGDCKDHVVLLKALLAAEGIKSDALLIQASSNIFGLPNVPQPFTFNHVITYVPEYSLFMDSTARYSPFGILPIVDVDHDVLNLDTGTIMKTPGVTMPTIAAQTTLRMNADGTADGGTIISVTGAWTDSYRAFREGTTPEREAQFFPAVLGAGSSGKFEPGTPGALDENFNFAMQYHIANFANLPGPGALPPQLGYKLFSFSEFIARSFPDSRDTDYVCSSGVADEDVALTLAPGVTVTNLTPVRNFTADGVELSMTSEKTGSSEIHLHTHLRMQHSAPVCTPAYYAKVHDALGGMLRALRGQLLYQ